MVLDKKIPIIIDTDPGTDDTYALFLAASSDKLDIKAITGVAGNMPAELTFENARDLNERLNINTIVAKGAKKPMCIHQRLGSFLHGDRGMGNLQIPKGKKDFDSRYAWDVIYDEAKKLDGELVLIPIGPLTNIAIALLKYRDLNKYIKEIVMMGGSSDYGNRSQYAEFNIWADPHAAQIVFSSGIPIKMLGLNVTNQSAIPFSEMDRLQAISSPINKEINALFYHYKEYFKKMGIKGIVIHDAVTIAAVINPEIITYKKAYVCVEYTGSSNSGRTITDFGLLSGAEANTQVGVEIDMKGYIDLLEKMMFYYKETCGEM